MNTSTCEVRSLFRLISGLSNVHRYSTNFLVKQESVLEHTGSVAILCAAIGHFIKENTDSTLDLGVLLSKASFHDLEESETGDVPRVTKYNNDQVRDGLKKFESQAISKIVEYTKVPNLDTIWKEAKEGKEGLIVSVVDLIVVTYKLYEEIVKLNNFSLSEVASQSIQHYAPLKQKVHTSFREGIINKEIEEYLTEVIRKSYAIGAEIIHYVENAKRS